MIKKRLIERILNRIVAGPRLEKASDNRWTVTSENNEQFSIPFGVLVERRGEAQVSSFIIGKYCIRVGTSPFENQHSPIREGGYQPASDAVPLNPPQGGSSFMPAQEQTQDQMESILKMKTACSRCNHGRDYCWCPLKLR